MGDDRTGSLGTIPRARGSKVLGQLLQRNDGGPGIGAGTAIIKYF